MTMMLLIKISECDDDDVANRKIKSVMMMMLLIKRSECGDYVSLRIVDDDDDD